MLAEASFLNGGDDVADTCAECRYMVTISEGNGGYACRRYPRVANNKFWSHPEVGLGDWCGEFSTPCEACKGRGRIGSTLKGGWTRSWRCSPCDGSGWRTVTTAMPAADGEKGEIGGGK